MAISLPTEKSRLSCLGLLATPLAFGSISGTPTEMPFQRLIISNPATRRHDFSDLAHPC
jgi:hypothetical protein